MISSAKVYLKKQRDVFFFRFIVKVIEILYLFLKHCFEIIKTQRHLSSNWHTISEVKIPIQNVIELRPPETKYYIYNPTLVNFNGELNFFARISNRSFMPKADKKGRTLQRSKVDNTYDGTCFFKISKNFDLIEFEVIINPHSPPCFQDPKAVIFNDEIVLFGNYLIKEPYGSDRSSIIQTAYYELKTRQINVLKNVSKKNIEKNWIPFSLKGRILTLVYKSKPFTIMKYNLEFNTAVFCAQNNNLVDLDYHGGSQFIELNEQLFARIVRFKHRLPKLGLINLSYVMLHNQNLEVTYVSKPFIFRKFGLEICNGLTVKDGRIFFAWGEDDIRMYTGSMPVNDFLQWVYTLKDIKRSRINILSKKVYGDNIGN
jgi:hypothetical protein